MIRGRLVPPNPVEPATPGIGSVSRRGSGSPRSLFATDRPIPRALAHCERALSGLAAKTGARVEIIRESVRRLLKAKNLREVLGERDFIYSAGLFDYLSARSFAALLSILYRTLAPGGQLAIGNVAAHNPSRHFMEYCADWFLIHRSREDLVALAKGLDPSPQSIEVDAEPTGLNLFLCVLK